MIRKRILSLLVCAALLCGVLAGCSTSSGSTAASSSSASASESIPSSTVTADTGKVGPLDAGENIKDAYTQWFDGLSADDQQSFADTWPLIKADAETLLTDKDSMTGRIEDAGLDAKELPGCSEENWKALADVIDVLVPASSEY